MLHGSEGPLTPLDILFIVFLFFWPSFHSWTPSCHILCLNFTVLFWCGLLYTFITTYAEPRPTTLTTQVKHVFCTYYVCLVQYIDIKTLKYLGFSSSLPSGVLHKQTRPTCSETKGKCRAFVLWAIQMSINHWIKKITFI